ncbi:DUF4835 family protein [Parabacteroides sp. PF5-9]|uniref:type IX secretion system protein PorD n=1 Tax=Parabacteroides sp. PF5-9 TaxID=1742404 RepID=UPI002476031D|nr:DUF4835 family protein [Parabacteroides sp. PF5-9]MDH6359249.1 hypothetical protein [Parabacteroides sp. PF5-9]
MRIINKLIVFGGLCLATLNTFAQEINARVTVNGSKISTTETRIFTTLQDALTEFINNRKWTDATFAVTERIDCNITILLNEMTDNTFKGEIQIAARRPVYNSSYTTALLNFRDTQLDFEYIEYEPLEYADNTLSSNLTATVVFYLYTILGLDFDSFSPKGGSVFYQQAQQIVNLAQGQASWSGWKAFDNNNNRHAVITALTENASETFRELWYTYHRKGLDEMAANADRGRTTILSALPALEQIKSARPTSVILQLFADAKLEEIVLIYSKATMQEKQQGYEMLSKLYPTQSTKFDALRN